MKYFLLILFLVPVAHAEQSKTKLDSSEVRANITLGLLGMYAGQEEVKATSKTCAQQGKYSWSKVEHGNKVSFFWHSYDLETGKVETRSIGKGASYDEKYLNEIYGAVGEKAIEGDCLSYAEIKKFVAATDKVPSMPAAKSFSLKSHGTK